MEKGFYRFKAVWSFEDGNGPKEHITNGYTYAESYAEAAQKIDDAFGKDLISMRLCALEPSTILEDDEITEWEGEDF